jgi:invasion protein IalB
MIRPVFMRGDSRTSILKSILALAVAVLGAHALVMRASATETGVKGTFGHWTVRCEIPTGAKTEQCALVQSVTAEEHPGISAVVIVLKSAENPGGKILRVVVPLGILLPAGLGLRIDDTDVGRTGFMRCIATGCVAEVVMDDALTNKLRVGDTAFFVIFQNSEEGIGLPVTLSGFSAGIDALP